MQKTGLPYPKALSRLRKAHDSMREAIGEDIEPRLRGMLQGDAEAAARRVTDGATRRPPDSPSVQAAPQAALHQTRRRAARSSNRSTSRCSCSNDAGTRGRDRAVAPSVGCIAPSSPPSRPARSVAALRMVPIPIDSASRGTREGIVAKERGVVAPRRRRAASRDACARAARRPAR